MPKELSVALRFTDQTELGATISPLFGKLGMVEFLNNRPGYTTELFTIYKYARVTAVDFRVCFTSKSINPIKVAIGFVPNADFASLTMPRFTDLTTTKWDIISATGGMDRTELRATYSTQNAIGNPNFSKYWMTAAQSASTTPIDNDEPVLIYGAAYAGGSTTLGAVIDWSVVYHVQFFELETPVLS